MNDDILNSLKMPKMAVAHKCGANSKHVSLPV